jgi:hypothetical protein
MKISAIPHTNGIVSPTMTFVAADPLCPPMRVFLDGIDISDVTMEVHGPRQPYLELAGWATVWIKPMIVNGQPLLETKTGMIKWEPVNL